MKNKPKPSDSEGKPKTRGRGIIRKDWEAIGNDFKVVGQDIKKALVFFKGLIDNLNEAVGCKPTEPRRT